MFSMNQQLENLKQKSKTIAKRTLWITLIGLVVAGIGYVVWRNYNYSQGTRSGVLVKISEKGWLFKTYEGQLNLAGSGGMMTPQSMWDFSANRAAYQQMQALEGKAVSLHYNQKVNAFPWQGDTDYIVDSAVPVGQ